jgi:NCAIR mutase (PurE)-related protein
MTTPIEHLQSFAHVDVLRRTRTGMPEIIYAASKTTDQVIAIADHMLAANGRVLISRPTSEMVERCLTTYADLTITRSTADRMLTVARTPIDHTQLGGIVGIIAAGTSDMPVADEAAMVCTELGCRVERVTDVGVTVNTSARNTGRCHHRGSRDGRRTPFGRDRIGRCTSHWITRRSRVWTWRCG